MAAAAGAGAGTLGPGSWRPRAVLSHDQQNSFAAALALMLDKARRELHSRGAGTTTAELAALSAAHGRASFNATVAQHGMKGATAFALRAAGSNPPGSVASAALGGDDYEHVAMYERAEGATHEARAAAAVAAERASAHAHVVREVGTMDHYHALLAELGARCDWEKCRAAARVLCLCRSDNGERLCARHDTAFHQRASHCHGRYTLVEPDGGGACPVLRELSRNEFVTHPSTWPLPAGAITSIAVPVPVFVPKADACPSCKSRHVRAMAWDTDANLMRVWAGGGKVYNVGAVSSVQCRACNKVRPMDTSERRNWNRSLLPFASSKSRSAIERPVMEAHHQADATAHAGRTPQELGRFLTYGTSLSVSDESLRGVVRVWSLFNAMVVPVLHGHIHPCMACADGAARVHIDGNFKLFQFSAVKGVHMAHQRGVRDVVHLASSTPKLLEALGGGAGEGGHGAATMCGDSTWRAAAESNKQNKAKSITGQMVVSCAHRAVLGMVPVHSAEQKAHQLVGFLLAAACGATMTYLDVACLFTGYTRRRAAIAPDFASAAAAALFPSVAGATVHVATSNAITVTFLKTAAAADLAPVGGAPVGGVDVLPVAMGGAAVDEDDGLPVAHAMLGVDVVAPPVVPVSFHAALSARGLPNSTVVSCALPLHHAAGHSASCQHTFSAAAVTGAGRGPETAEHVNSALSARAHAGRVMAGRSLHDYFARSVGNYNQHLDIHLPASLAALWVKARGRLYTTSTALAHAKRGHSSSTLLTIARKLEQRRQLLHAGAAAVDDADKKTLDQFMRLHTLTAGVNALARVLASVDAVPVEAHRLPAFLVALQASVDATALAKKRNVKTIDQARGVVTRVSAEVEKLRTTVKATPLHANLFFKQSMKRLRDVFLRHTQLRTMLLRRDAVTSVDSTSIRRQLGAVYTEAGLLVDTLNALRPGVTDAAVRAWTLPTVQQLADGTVQLPRQIGGMVFEGGDENRDALLDAHQHAARAKEEVEFDTRDVNKAVTNIERVVDVLRAQLEAATGGEHVSRLAVAAGQSGLLVPVEDHGLLFGFTPEDVKASSVAFSPFIAYHVSTGLATMKELHARLRRLQHGIQMVPKAATRALPTDHAGRRIMLRACRRLLDGTLPPAAWAAMAGGVVGSGAGAGAGGMSDDDNSDSTDGEGEDMDDHQGDPLDALVVAAALREAEARAEEEGEEESEEELEAAAAAEEAGKEDDAATDAASL